MTSVIEDVRVAKSMTDVIAFQSRATGEEKKA
jgi:hypothetical protein